MGGACLRVESDLGGTWFLLVVGYGAIFFFRTCEERGLALRDRLKAPGLPLYVFYEYFLALLRAFVTCYAATPIRSSVYVRSLYQLSILAQLVAFFISK